MGKNGRDIFSTFTFSDSEKDNIEAYMEKFSGYFNPRANTVLSRYIFHKTDQRERESTDQYITELQILVQD